MRFSYNNYIELDDTVLTASTELGRYYVENIKETQLTKKFSFDGNSGNVVIDLTSAQDITTFIINTNITSSGTITLEANSSDAWGAPPYQQAITLLDNNHTLFLDESYRYWRVVLSDATLTNVEINFIHLGEYFTPPYVEAARSYTLNTNSLRRLGLSFQSFGSKRANNKTIVCQFPVLALDDFDSIQSFWQTYDIVNPFFLIERETSLSDKNPTFVVFEEDSLTFEKDIFDRYTYSITFTEVK